MKFTPLSAVSLDVSITTQNSECLKTEEFVASKSVQRRFGSFFKLLMRNLHIWESNGKLSKFISQLMETFVEKKYFKVGELAPSSLVIMNLSSLMLESEVTMPWSSWSSK